MSRSNRPAYARASRRSTKKAFSRVRVFFFRDRAIGGHRLDARLAARCARVSTRDARFPIPRASRRDARDASSRRSVGNAFGRSRSRRRCGRGIERLRARAYLLAERRDAGDVVDVVEDAGAKGRLRERGHGVKHVRAGAQRHLFQRGGLLALAQVAPLTVATGLAGKRSAARARREGGRSCERGNSSSTSGGGRGAGGRDSEKGGSGRTSYARSGS